MQGKNTVGERLRLQLGNFAKKSERPNVEFHGNTDLINEAGFTSREGLEFVLDLCDEFEFNFPADFNPFVDDAQRRGQTFDGLVKAIERHLACEGAPNGKKN